MRKSCNDMQNSLTDQTNMKFSAVEKYDNTSIYGKNNIRDCLSEKKEAKSIGRFLSNASEKKNL